METTALKKGSLAKVIILFISLGLLFGIYNSPEVFAQSVFEDDFEDGVIEDQWNIILGDWDVVQNGGSEAAHLNPSSVAYRRMVSISSVPNDVTITARIKGACSVPGEICADMSVGFWSDEDADFFYYVIIGAWASGRLAISRYENGTITSLDTNLNLTFSSGVWYHIKIKLEGTRIDAKAWKVGNSEPGVWHVSYTGATPFGNHIMLAGIPGTNGDEEFWFDDVVVTGEEPGPPPEVQSVTIEPEWPEISSLYTISVQVYNPWEYSRYVELTLAETGFSLVLGQATWDLDVDLQSQGASALIPPYETVTLTYTFEPHWNWIPAWDWTMLASQLANFAGLVGLNVSDLTTAYDALSACNFLAAQAMEYTINDVSPSTIDIDKQTVTVRVSLAKNLLLISSLATGFLGNVSTITCIALSPCPICAAPFCIAEVACIAASNLSYFAATDPDSNYTEMVTPTFIEVPELDTIPESPSKDLALALIEAYAYTDAMCKSYAKYKGAHLDTAYYWEAEQAGAVSAFAGEVTRLLASSGLTVAEIDAARRLLYPCDIAAARDSIASSGLPDVEVSVLEHFGITGDAVDSIASGMVQGLENAESDTLPAMFKSLRSTLEPYSGTEIEFRSTQLQVRIEKLGDPIDTVSTDTLDYLDSLSQVITDSLQNGSDNPAIWALIDTLRSQSLSLALSSNDTTVLSYYSAALGHSKDYYEMSFDSGAIFGSVHAPDTSSADLQVKLLDSVGAPLVEVTTDDSGYYQIDSIPNGDYTVELQVPSGLFHASSGLVPITLGGEYMQIDFWLVECGDIDGSGATDVGDLTYLVAYLFQGGSPPPVLEAANVDGSSSIDVGDLTYLVAYLFQGGPAPTCAPVQ